jgi:hypothetical protein
MPLVPRGGRLSSDSRLICEMEGYRLELSASHRIFPIAGDQVQAPFFAISAERSSNNNNNNNNNNPGKLPVLKVHCLGPWKQPVQPQTEEKQYLLLENFSLDSKVELRGALLHLVRHAGSRTFLHYDRTVRAILHNMSDVSEVPASYLLKSPTTSLIYLERSMCCLLKIYYKSGTKAHLY